MTSDAYEVLYFRSEPGLSIESVQLLMSIISEFDCLYTELISPNGILVIFDSLPESSHLAEELSRRVSKARQKEQCLVNDELIVGSASGPLIVIKNAANQLTHRPLGETINRAMSSTQKPS